MGNCVREYMDTLLKKAPGIRQALTDVLNGPNIYWDEKNWRFAQNMDDEGVMIHEGMAWFMLKESQRHVGKQ